MPQQNRQTIVRKNRKDKAYYFAAMLLSLGFAATLLSPGSLTIYVAFASAMGSLTTLYWGANVANKHITKEAYLKELEGQQEE